MTNKPTTKVSTGYSTYTSNCPVTSQTVKTETKPFTSTYTTVKEVCTNLPGGYGKE